MLAFFYFVQMINNLPKMLMISWNNMIFLPKQSDYTLKISTVSEKLPELWMDSEDALRRNLIVNVSICEHFRDDENENVQFSWKLSNGSEVLERRKGSNCSEQFQIDSQHSHKIVLKIYSKRENLPNPIEISKNIEKSEIFWLAAIGDSFSSGQGSPDVPMTRGKPAKWLDESCYRSSNAFPYKVFQSLPNSVLSFFSCSGATVDNGILSKNGQLEKLDEMIQKNGGAPPDALILTVGGNDIGFTDIISLIQRDTSIEASFDMRFFYVSHQIDRVAAKIEELRIKRVILLDYYDVTRNEQGTVDASCGAFGQVSLANLQLAERKILRRLNKLLFKKAAQHGWITVDTSETFRTHGICSKTPLIRSPNESIALQGNEYGSFHPNEEAHRRIAKQILKILKMTTSVNTL